MGHHRRRDDWKRKADPALCSDRCPLTRDIEEFTGAAHHEVPMPWMEEEVNGFVPHWLDGIDYEAADARTQGA